MTPSNQLQEQNEVLAILGTRHRCLWNKYSDEKRFQLYKLSKVTSDTEVTPDSGE